LSNVTDKIHPLRDWLLHQGRYIDGFETFSEELALTLNRCGFDICRLNLGAFLLHPDIAGVAFQWYSHSNSVLAIPVAHADLQQPAYLQSPIRAAVHDNRVIRIRIEEATQQYPFPVIKEFEKDGITDYAVLPLPGAKGRTNVWSIGTRNPEGFSDKQWQILQDFSLYLSLVVDYLAVQWLAGVLMEVYLGQRTGKRVWNGQVKRGDGQRIKAALWYCDMRGFTQLSNTMPPEELIILLNEYFGHLGPAVHAHGGEILKFIGDAILAVFPVNEDTGDLNEACSQCLRAAQGAHQNLSVWSQKRIEQGDLPIESGIGLHLGEVVYGNIGTEGRLDFTVISEAVNQVARVEGMCASLGHPLLATKEFVAHIPNPNHSLGSFSLKGIENPVEIFELH